ncbi:hypothetical protein SLS55_000024 [Diplodia seriata]|uniref:DUF4038 domain-containing protein n=1 Tax=Diplodia seriata TaxID=420778 RepID=A0ABR3CU17_9PEZI
MDEHQFRLFVRGLLKDTVLGSSSDTGDTTLFGVLNQFERRQNAWHADAHMYEKEAKLYGDKSATEHATDHESRVCYKLVEQEEFGEESAANDTEKELEMKMSKAAADYAILPSPDGHFFQHTNGTPFFWQADTAWLLFHRLNHTECETYLTDRAAKGFTIVLAVGLTQIGIDSPNRNGDLPFIDDDVTQPNEPYWAHIDTIIALAWSKRIRIALFPAWGKYINGKSVNAYWNASDVRVGSWQAMYVPGLFDTAGSGPAKSWAEDLHLPGAGQMGYIKKAIEDRGDESYFRRVPAQDLIVGDAGTDDKRVTATRDADGSWIMAYTPTGNKFSVDTEPLTTCEISAYCHQYLENGNLVFNSDGGKMQ